MKLAYRAYDGTGREVQDTIEAATTMDAIEELRRDGFFVARIEADAKSAPARLKPPAWLGFRRRQKNLCEFTRQLYVLVASGTPMVQALSVLGRQAGSRQWKEVIADLCSQVEEGKPLSEAMASHPAYFSPVYRSLISAAESTGEFTGTLDRLSKLQQKRLHAFNAILGAMIYPSLLLIIASSVLILLMVFVVPSFSTLFATLDVPLPASTKIMINISKFVVSYWYILVGLLVTGIFGIRLWLQSAHGKRTIDSMVLRLPVVGRIMRGFLTARIARTLGILLEARVPITDALPLAREGAGNVHYAELLSRAKDAVISGKSISDGLSGSDLVNPCICEAVRNGERSGVVGRVLLEIADFMDEENQTLLRSLTSLLEPVILVILGLLVGLVAVSLFLPLFDITAMTQGSGP